MVSFFEDLIEDRLAVMDLAFGFLATKGGLDKYLAVNSGKCAMEWEHAGEVEPRTHPSIDFFRVFNLTSLTTYVCEAWEEFWVEEKVGCCSLAHQS
jgi:hypothetical protein